MFNFTENQAAAINTLSCNVSVSAGAGSGKTRVLVERFINILAQVIKNPQQAVQPKEILAINFYAQSCGGDERTHTQASLRTGKRGCCK